SVKELVDRAARDAREKQEHRERNGPPVFKSLKTEPPPGPPPSTRTSRTRTSSTPPPGTAPGKRTVKLASVDRLKMRPVRWLARDFLPRGTLVLLAGDGGEGKSAITLHVAAMVSRGLPCFDMGYDPPPPATVILVGCEDAVEQTVLPRLAAAGADLKN